MPLYHVLMLQSSTNSEGAPVWRQLGQVKAHNGDAAIMATLEREQILSGHCVAIPDRSWNPNEYAGTPKVHFTKGAKAAKSISVS